LESTAAVGLHSREVFVRADIWPSESLGGDSPTPVGDVDGVPAAEGAIEPSGANATAASGEVSTLIIPATAKYIAM
jgi:hypothetical protein